MSRVTLRMLLACHCLLGGLVVASCTRPVEELEVSGQVFVVTRAGVNMKLGLVEVNAIPLDSLKQHIQARTELWGEEVATRNRKRGAELDSLLRVREKQWLAAPAIAKANEIAYIQGQIAESQYLGGVNAYEGRLREQLAALRVEREALRPAEEPEPSADWLFSGLPRPIRTSKTDADGRFLLRLPKGTPVALVAQGSREVVELRERYHWMVEVPASTDRAVTLLLSNDNLTTAGPPASFVKAWEQAGQ